MTTTTLSSKTPFCRLTAMTRLWCHHACTSDFFLSPQNFIGFAVLQSRHRSPGEPEFNLQQPGKGTPQVFPISFISWSQEEQFQLKTSVGCVNNSSHFPDSVAGTAMCNQAATCWTTRWCTRPTGSSPSTASPSSARPSATSILESLPVFIFVSSPQPMTSTVFISAVCCGVLQFTLVKSGRCWCYHLTHLATPSLPSH